MWELDYKESWAPKDWFFWTVVLEKTLESPLDCKEIKPVHPKRNQSWIYSLEGLMLKLKLQYWPPDVTVMLGKIEGRKRRRQQRMRWLDGITDSMDMSLSMLVGVGDGQGGLACCSPWVAKSPTWLSNWTELKWTAAKQAPLSMRFPRQKYWSGLPFLLQGIFLTQGPNLHLFLLVHWQVSSSPLSHLGSPLPCVCIHNKNILCQIQASQKHH